MNNSSSSQRARMLEWLFENTLTTIQARRHLDILHPAGRIKELRRFGHNIATVWTQAETDCGKSHRVGMYVLRHG